MSMAAVIVAARNVLRTEFALDANSCEVGFDGQPKPAAGEFYVALHPMNWTFPNGDHDLHENYDIGVTLTLRMGFVPKDRWGIAVWLLESNGMEPRIRRVITALHHNQDVRVAANVAITGGASGKIMTPLQVIRVENPKPRNYDWFSAAPPESPNQVAECGVSQTVVFGKCQRLQSIEDMD